MSAVLPEQVTLFAAISPSARARSSRNVRAFSEPHFIGSLKVTVTLVSTDTSTAPFIGFVDTTSGRVGFDEAAKAGALAAHTIITNAAIEIRLTMHFSFIEPVACWSGIGPTSTTQGLCPVGDHFWPSYRSS